MKVSCFLLGFLVYAVSFSQEMQVEKWDVFETVFHGPEDGNPFMEVELYAVFSNGEKEYTPAGFYDGKGVYKIRFMPNEEGCWTYQTKSNVKELDGLSGEFTCTSPSVKNYGPVKVRNEFHFGFEDGSRFIPLGTTAYEWSFQNESTKEQTLQSLKEAPFNKLRFLVVPPYDQRYVQGKDSLSDFPFPRDSESIWDFERFNPDFFQDLEKDVENLLSLGIQADLILFHPYDDGKWGFDVMGQETNRRFLTYVVARLAAYRNVWWSLANEHSFMEEFSDEDWDELFQLLQKEDPYDHLRSIHNAGRIYDYNKPWVTHVSLQYYNAVRVPGVTPLLRDLYRKPIVHDEINYEGKSPKRWGQLSGEELAYRIWNAYIGGGYATHGEVLDEDWLSNGGKLSGESPVRLDFLKKIVEEGPEEGLEPVDQYYLSNVAGKPGEYYLFYFGKDTPESWKFILPDHELEKGDTFKVDILDTWNMTVQEVPGDFEVERLDNYRFIDRNKTSINLPGKPYMAIRIQKK